MQYLATFFFGRLSLVLEQKKDPLSEIQGLQPKMNEYWILARKSQ
jgi:hypothetical protein